MVRENETIFLLLRDSDGRARSLARSFSLFRGISTFYYFHFFYLVSICLSVVGAHCPLLLLFFFFYVYFNCICTFFVSTVVSPSLSPLSLTFHSFSQSARMSSSSAVCVHLGEDKAAAANFDCQWHCHHHHHRHQNLRQSRECTVCLTLSSVVVVVVVENVCSRRAEMCSGKREVFRFFFCSVFREWSKDESEGKERESSVKGSVKRSACVCVSTAAGQHTRKSRRALSFA